MARLAHTGHAPVRRTPQHGALHLTVREVEQRIRAAFEHRRTQLAPRRLVVLVVDGVLDPVERAEAVVVVLLREPGLVGVLAASSS